MRTRHFAVLLIFLSLWGVDTHAARLQLSRMRTLSSMAST